MKVILLSLLCAFILGCGTSSPRFGSTEAPKKSEKHEKKSTSPRFSSKHIEEETKEDDRKIDVKQVAARFSSAKPAPAKRGTSPPSNESRGESPRAAEKLIPQKINDQKMMDVILSYLGTPYQYGGDSKSGIDCSAFTSAVYDQSVRLKLPRTAGDQVKQGKQVLRDELKFGDLMFFNTTGANPSHVGIYIGDDLFAHASEAFGVTISSIESSYYKKRYTEARRIIDQ
jgi:cell wall-associated NlpC family hydrolase